MVGVLAFFMAASFTLVAGPEKFPDTAAGKRLKEVVDLVNEGSRKKWNNYMTETFTREFLDFAPLEQHLDIFSETCDTYGSFEFKGADEASAFRLSASLWSPLTESWVNLRMRVEEAPPHRIGGIGIGPGRPPAGTVPAGGKTDREIAKDLERFLQKLAKADKFSGTVLLARDNKILFKGAYGLASKRFDVANRIDTKFNLGSMNKMFTAVAIAQLVEKGKLSYDDPVGKYLDSAWVQPETAEKVRIKHLLSHTAGLGSFFNDKFWKSSRLLYRELADWQPLIKDKKLKFEPGSQWSYSNTGMFLLGPVIEKVTGQGYYDYIREHIYKPLGMVNSDCYEMDRPVPNLAIGYYKKFEEEGFDWRNNILLHSLKGGPAGGGFSTVEDLFRFGRALMETKLIGRESVELLTTPKPALNSPRYGYGFVIKNFGDESVVGHSGGFPGINSILQIYKKSGYIYAIMSNYSQGISAVNARLAALLLPE
jgi:CubicO group peptidase (beta-lactamase class C family)